MTKSEIIEHMCRLTEKVQVSKEFSDDERQALDFFWGMLKARETEAHRNAMQAAHYTAQRFRRQAGGLKGGDTRREELQSSHAKICEKARDLLRGGRQPRNVSSLVARWAHQNAISPSSAKGVRGVLKEANII